MKKTTNNKGFSLIELIIVIAIMAVLVAVIAPNLTKYLGSSKENTDTKNKDEIASTVNTCITDYEMSNSTLIPDGDSKVVVIQWNASGSTVTNGDSAGAFKKIVDTAIDATKTQSKVDTSKYAYAKITKDNDTNAYKIEVDFGTYSAGGAAATTAAGTP